MILWMVRYIAFGDIADKEDLTFCDSAGVESTKRNDISFLIITIRNQMNSLPEVLFILS